MKLMNLGDLIKIHNGRDHKHLKPGNIPVYGSGGVMRYVDEKLHSGDCILLPRKGSLANIMLVQGDFWTVDTMYYATVNTALADPHYLAEYLKHLDLSRLDTGSAVPSMTSSVYYNIPISIHPLDEQKRIGSLISLLHKNIDKIEQQIQELEQTAQDIYDYWFVQYDFPDENGNPYRSSGGKMTWNNDLNREIPHGWGASYLGNYFKVTMGQSPPGSSLNDSRVGTEFYQGATYFDRLFPSQSSWSTEPSRFAQEGDVLLSVRAPVGKWNIALNPCAIGRGLSAISPSRGGLFYLLGTIQLLMPILERMNSNGTTYGAINSPNLRALPVLAPPADLVIRFEAHTHAMKEQIFNLERMRRELIVLKQTLIPLLLNGQASFSSQNPMRS